ncbi:MULTISPECIES: CBS domain-containing protein [Cyanophyceae]|uniref:CBS domain-containing protein n=1 Tax=Cyanophyceae TaxID=3028117 RepID=UPI0016875DF1|nr:MULTISPECIES: CBS domain-containing protein [Cyanophyceae]MBD1915403.1 CBS domain-containing protein [Phormidium sp. FACHB-77]MBD2032404.1 CBS domain-containing protein [Phormidium sp. FACHB-322]MBD2052575.1 CBS domain-containing protein [Leptolyngbya sp. FACHB-60]
MDLVLCHTTADFDTLGAAVGLARLQPGRRIVLTGGCHPTVQRFLALHRDEYPLIERRAVDPSQINRLTLVDAQQRDRFGPAADWITQAEHNQVPIEIYDHHPTSAETVQAQETMIEAVGAATTLVVESLQQQKIEPSVAEATVMALGIHVDTGSLLYEGATARDASALAWLMAHGASLAIIADFVEPGLSPTLQGLLTEAMASLHVEAVGGHALAWVLLRVDGYVPGLSGLAERLISLVDADALLFGAHYAAKEEADADGLADSDLSDPSLGIQKLTLIGRARGRVSAHLDWGTVLTALGGGGHAAAASANLTTEDPLGTVQEVMAAVRSHLPRQPTARDLMSSPVRTIRPDTTIHEAQRILLRYGHSGLSVVDEGDRLVGIISRRDLDLALHHGFSHAPVKGYMATNLKTIVPDTPLTEIEHLMVTYDIGRLPVLHQRALVGIVTRTDLLRHLHQGQPSPSAQPALLDPPAAITLQRALEASLSSVLQDILQQITAAAEERGWHLYLVGGAVRDLLICTDSISAALPDLDLVVDGFFSTAQVGAGVDLATVIKERFPEVDLQVHGRFQTASLVWRKELDHPLAGLMIDIATARTEFYPYPAANPEVEASSIQQDLYRRDFTINALALRLTNPGSGQLLDYFGGLIDLRQGTIRVLHANSFIEDPTRIYRAVRFAVRLGFSLDAQTEGYIHHAMASGVYSQMQHQMRRAPALQVRLKNELKYILEAPYWQSALTLLDQLGALRCLHSELTMTPALWQQLRRLSRWTKHFGWPELGPPWLLRLQGLLAAIPAMARSPLATHLQLPDRAIERLTHLDQWEQQWQILVANEPAPSQLYAAFSQADLPTHLLISARHPRQLGSALWRYLMQWASTAPLIDGDQLKTLGYRPGPSFRPMLEALFAAQLDGAIATQSDAIAFLEQHYPQC